MAEGLEARSRGSVLENDRGTVDEPAGRDGPLVRILDRREHARRAGAAGRRPRRLLRSVDRSNDDECQGSCRGNRSPGHRVTVLESRGTNSEF